MWVIKKCFNLWARQTLLAAMLQMMRMRKWWRQCFLTPRSSSGLNIWLPKISLCVLSLWFHMGRCVFFVCLCTQKCQHGHGKQSKERADPNPFPHMNMYHAKNPDPYLLTQFPNSAALIPSPMHAPRHAYINFQNRFSGAKAHLCLRIFFSLGMYFFAFAAESLFRYHLFSSFHSVEPFFN